MDENVPVIRPTSPLAWCREPADKSDVGASGTPHCCHEHETQIPLVEAPPGDALMLACLEEARDGDAGRALRRLGRAQGLGDRVCAGA